MTRLAAQGRISEFFGEKAVNIDKFMRIMEFYSLSQKSIQFYDEKDIAIYSSYLNGINDYVQNISLFGFDSHSTARVLPPEFYIFGMSGDKLEPFTMADIISIARLISFHLSWNWNQDLEREALRQNHPDIADLVEELVPFSSEFLSALVTVVDDDDLKEWGQYSE
jgi:penicillin amidase